jgi:Tfp pilus tip-associated adhesin PilY1
MSDVTKGDFIYQSTFKYEKDKQWKGNLKKYKLKADGTFDAEQWDAATKLNNKKASSRNIMDNWNWKLISLNNFTTSNRDQLKPLLFPNAQNAVSNTS